MYHETQKLHLRCYDVFRYAVLDVVAGSRGLFRFRYLLAEPVQHLRAVFRSVRIGRLGGGVKVVGGIGSGVAGSVGCLLGAGSELFCGVSQGISEIACEPCYVPRLSCCRQDDSYLR